MKKSIENEYLKITVSSKGAELISIRSKSTGLEYLWQGKSERWEGKSPVLFPIIASLENNRYQVGKDTYQLPIHGFAMHKKFQFMSEEKNALTFQLSNDHSTYKVYPYKFLLTVTYILDANTIQTIYKVNNIDDKPIWFCIGGHPTFACPIEQHLAFTDYYLEFDKKEMADRHLMTGALMNGQTEPFLQQERSIPLKKDLFSENAIILKNLKSKNVTLHSDKGICSVRLSIAGFPHLGIFSYANSAEDKYICLEPWHGIPGIKGKEKYLQDKEGIIKVKEGKEFVTSFTIEVMEE
jgi:galactose mutarotase-like enzyme